MFLTIPSKGDQFASIKYFKCINEMMYKVKIPL